MAKVAVEGGKAEDMDPMIAGAVILPHTYCTCVRNLKD
jgi:hypothetical protein